MAKPKRSGNNRATELRSVPYLEGMPAQVKRVPRLRAETVGELDAIRPSLPHRAFDGDL